MGRWAKRLGVLLVAILVLLAGAITATVGWRPFLGAKSRPLTDRKFEKTEERLVRGRYLVEHVNGCVYCHSELDWKQPGFPVKPGTEGSGRNWALEGMPFLTAPNITSDPETGAAPGATTPMPVPFARASGTTAARCSRSCPT